MTTPTEIADRVTMLKIFRFIVSLSPLRCEHCQYELLCLVFENMSHQVRRERWPAFLVYLRSSS
jgi:hypothetical protein